jgi:phosphoribosylglycinamide formyltransferase-1
MKRIVCLISGRGSNLAALLAAARAEQWLQSPGAGVVAVVSNRADAGGLALAASAGIPASVVAHDRYASREAFEVALAEAIDASRPDLVVLAGFMRVLTTGFVRRYAGRLLIIHPSLLPAFPGLHTHRQALAAGVRLHGATVHYVSDVVDAGAIVAQAVVPVHEDDTEDTLAARVLAREHVLLPRCVRWVLEGRARLGEDGRVHATDLAADARCLLPA